MMDLAEIPPDWADHVGEELRKTFRRYQESGFFQRFFSGTKILDIGYKGYIGARPIFPHAVGVDLDYPGYDGKRLPFDDHSQDTVFASHTLEHVADYRSTIAEWFRVLRVGGFLVVAVPHQFLYERKRALPSRWNEDHRRFYTSASLLAEIEEALDPMEYRIRYLEENDADFDYSIPPDRHAGGGYEIVIALERIERPAYADAVLNDERKPPEQGRFRPHPSPPPGSVEPLLAIEGKPPGFREILALKLDHRGDFVLARPAFTDLRRHFPQARITLACGPWNAAAARELGLFDDVVEFEFFNETGPKPGSTELLEKEFGEQLKKRKFDLALDLRVDEDTRKLLSQVKADHRAGFGRVERFPFLDIALPFINPTLAGRARRIVVAAERFVCRLGQHEGLVVNSTEDAPALPKEEPFLFGPWMELEPGNYELEIFLEPLGKEFQMKYDVCMNSARDITAIGALDITANRHPRISVQLDDPVKDFEVRFYPLPGAPLRPFRFAGCLVTKAGSLQGPHQREMQSLLVHLAALRSRHPYTIRELES